MTLDYITKEKVTVSQEAQTVEEMYAPGHLKPGNSVKVDQAICSILAVFGLKPFNPTAFRAAWGELLETLVSEFPNICVHNLCLVEMPLLANDLDQENLIVCRFMAAVGPKSWESQCFLGHAHRKLGHLVAATTCYQHAYDLVMDYSTQTACPDNHPLRLDAADYLRHLAETENELELFADALAHAAMSFGILKASEATFKYARLYEALERICLKMGAADLAESYRLKAEEAEASRR